MEVESLDWKDMESFHKTNMGARMGSNYAGMKCRNHRPGLHERARDDPSGDNSGIKGLAKSKQGVICQNSGLESMN